MNTPSTISIGSNRAGSDKLEADERDGHFNIEIESPWAGDSISGFGRECHMSLNREQAKELADWIYGRLGLEGNPQ